MNKYYINCFKVYLNKSVFINCLLCFLLSIGFNIDKANAQRVRYVSATPRGKQDGSSWTNASSDLHKMINQSDSHDQVWVEGDFQKPTMYTKVTLKDKNSGVKGYIMKMCTYRDENPSSYIFMDPHKPVRIPKYEFQVIHSKSKVNPSLYLVLQIV